MSTSFTPSQLTTYLTHISHPFPSPSLPQIPHPTAPSPAFLRTLHTHQICTVPYENLSLHYSPDRKISLDPQVLFEKFVGGGKNGRGGYCMENSIFFNHVLKGLGFRVYTAGARIRLRGRDGVPRGEFTGWYIISSFLLFPFFSLDNSPSWCVCGSCCMLFLVSSETLDLLKAGSR